MWLRQSGYRFVNSSQIISVPDGEKTATLEFDDGFEDIYTNAFPVLKRYGVPGSVYPILDLIGTPGHMTQSQLDELAAAGWELGSHTRSHATLPDLSPAGLARELTFPKGFVCVAYPFSRDDARVRRLTAERTSCGVAGSFGVHARDRYALLGPKVTPWDTRFMKLRASTGFDPRVPGLAAAAGVALLDRQGQQEEFPRFWNPARFETVGSGLAAFGWQGGTRDYDFAARVDHLMLNALLTRGEGHLNAVSLAVNRYPFTTSLGFSQRGVLLGAELALNNYGDAWLRYDRELAGGIDLIPLDYLQLRAEYSASRGLAAEAQYALPYNAGEGRPLNVLAGYDHKPYVGVHYQIGSFDLRGTVRSDLSGFGVKFTSLF